MSPRVVIGAPLFEKAAYLPEAIESLLGQRFGDFALVLIDDRSSDDTAAICRRYAREDPRVVVHVNETRLGMLDNTRRALHLPLALFPDAEFWALGSDHDRWAPDCLATLAGLLDEHPGAVLAYGLSRRIDEHGRPFARAKPPWRFDTAGDTDPRLRMRRAFRGMAAGDMIYGLFRVEALTRVGPYRGVLVPDRLLLSELALRGEFRQADAVLWERRFRGLAELDRQRAAFWPDGPPAYAALPWWLTHVGVMAWEYGVHGKGADVGIGRAAGARLAADYLDVSIRHRLWRRRRRLKGRVVQARDRALGPPVRAALRVPAVAAVTRRAVVPALRRTEETLERLTDAG